MKFLGVLRLLAVQWRTKLFLAGILTSLFWAGYFSLQHFPVFPETMMAPTKVDRWIPFLPDATPIYLSQFLTMPLILGLTTSRRRLISSCLGLVLIMAVAFVFFFFRPTFVSRPTIPPGSYPLLEMLWSIDRPRNACPSLHAAFVIFLAGQAVSVFREFQCSRCWILAAWISGVAVLVSTLLIKQHVLLDLVAGSVLGIGGLLAASFALRRGSP